jgi:hypothetical protein
MGPVGPMGILVFRSSLQHGRRASYCFRVNDTRPKFKYILLLTKTANGVELLCR